LRTGCGHATRIEAAEGDAGQRDEIASRESKILHRHARGD